MNRNGESREDRISRIRSDAFTTKNFVGAYVVLCGINREDPYVDFCYDSLGRLGYRNRDNGQFVSEEGALELMSQHSGVLVWPRLHMRKSV